MSCRSNECVLAPSKPKEFSLYVHNLQNVKQWDEEGLPSLSRSTTMGLITRLNIKGATHDLCHLPTYQHQGEFVVKFNVQPWRRGHLGAGVSVSLSPSAGGGEPSHYTSVSDLKKNHRTQFVLIIIITARTQGQERGCNKQHPVLVR